MVKVSYLIHLSIWSSIPLSVCPFTHLYIYRFPCCGKVYPCDVCHDTAEDHPMERANRMICGYCSREQVSSCFVCLSVCLLSVCLSVYYLSVCLSVQTYNGTKPCTLCGSNLAHIHVTPHWEGGQGCRNKTNMSRCIIAFIEPLTCDISVRFRNDRQKYKNSTNKTLCMKNQRVGAKGKANQAKK